MSVVKKSPINTPAVTKRLGTGEPVTKEPKIERMLVERLLNQDEIIASRSITPTASDQKHKSKTRKSYEEGIKICELGDHVTKYDAVTEVARALFGFSIGTLWREDAV